MINVALAQITSADFDPLVDYTAVQRQEAYVIAREEYLAMLFLQGCDKHRYGYLLNKLHLDFTLKVESYPKTLQAAYSLLTDAKPNHVQPVYGTQFLQTDTEEASSAALKKEKKGNSIPNWVKCWGCQKEGQHMSNCTNPKCMQQWKEKQKLHADQKNKKDEEKKQGQQHLNYAEDSDDDSFDVNRYHDTDFGSFGSFESAHSHCNVTDDVKVPWYFILLDNESTHHTFYTKKYLRNIRKANVPLQVNTNGGVIIYDQWGDFDGLERPVYYNPDGIANILSFAKVEEES